MAGYRAGDRVLILADVRQIGVDDSVWVSLNGGHDGVWVRGATIHGLAPEPPLKAGDQVIANCHEAEVLCVDGEMAWVRYSKGNYESWPVSSLIRRRK